MYIDFFLLFKNLIKKVFKKKNKIFLYIKKIFIFFNIIIVIFSFFYSCKREREISKTEILFSTFVEIKIRTDGNEKKVVNDIEKVFNFAKKIGDDLDFHVKNSYVSILNRDKKLKIPENYLYFFKKNLEYIKITDGYFNPFIKDLEKLYNYFKKDSLPPDEDDIAKAVNQLKKVRYSIENNLIYLSQNASVDFGGSAKGYIVDKIYEKLKKYGYTCFLINAGGDIRVYSNNNKWFIGIQSPIEENKIIGIVGLKNKSIVTSGNYERYFIYRGKRYFHILNPYTGKPDSDLSSVTVIDNSCFIADILSTALFAMGKQKAIRYINEYNIKALLVWFDFNGKMYYYDNAGIKLNNTLK